jgi:hypothetical protein
VLTTSAAASLAYTGSILDLKVQDPGMAWRRMEPRWELIETLIGGTLLMQTAGRRWLPQEPKESDDSYKTRLARSVCPPYYTRLEQMLAGMINRKPVRLENVNEVITQHLFDTDLQGNDLNVFTYDLARKVIRYGHCGVLVDFPRGDESTQPGDRPYWLTYTPRDILGWRTDILNGTQKLTQLRLREEVVVPYDGGNGFGEELIEQVRVLEPGSYRLFRKQPSKGGDFELVAEGTTTLDEIPFAVAYGNRVGQLESTPPLEEVAYLNLQAYRVGSDLSNQLHIAAVPRFHLYGVPAELDEITAGPDSAMALPVDARAEFVEPQGTSYGFQFQQLESIRDQINQLGLATIIGQKNVAESGLAKSMDRSQGDSALMTVALGIQDTIDNCLKYHAAYLGISQVGSSMVNTDFVSNRIEPTHAAELMKLWQSGAITQETLLIQLADGEWLYDDFSVDDELEATAAMQQSRLEAQEAQLQGAINELPTAPAEDTEEPDSEDPQAA